MTNHMRAIHFRFMGIILGASAAVLIGFSLFSPRWFVATVPQLSLGRFAEPLRELGMDITTFPELMQPPEVQVVVGLRREQSCVLGERRTCMRVNYGDVPLFMFTFVGLLTLAIHAFGAFAVVALAFMGVTAGAGRRSDVFEKSRYLVMASGVGLLLSLLFGWFRGTGIGGGSGYYSNLAGWVLCALAAAVLGYWNTLGEDGMPKAPALPARQLVLPEEPTTRRLQVRPRPAPRAAIELQDQPDDPNWPRSRS